MRSIIEKIKQSIKRFADDLPRDLIRRGSALGLVLVFMTFMLILGTGLLTVGQYMVVQSRTIGEADKSYYAAESAAQLAAQLLLKELATKGADGTTSGVLVVKVATVPIASIANAANPASDPFLKKMAEKLIASLAIMYQEDVRDVVGRYDAGKGSLGYFNDLPTTLGVLKVSSGGTVEEISPSNINNLFAAGIINVDGLNEKFIPQKVSATGAIISDSEIYPAVAVYFTNPNFILTARSGGRVVEVNTKAKLDFKLNIKHSTKAIYGADAKATEATIGNVMIRGKKGEEIEKDKFKFTIYLRGDEFTNNAQDTFNATNWNLFSANIPSGVTITCSDVNAERTVATFDVSGKPTEAMTAPIRLVIPADALESGLELKTTINEDAKWAITGNENTNGSGNTNSNKLRVPTKGVVVDSKNEPGLYQEYKAFIDERIAEADKFASSKANFIPNDVKEKLTPINHNNPVLSFGDKYVKGNTVRIHRSGTYYLEYLDCTKLEVYSLDHSPVVATFPYLKGIYVSGDMSVQQGNSIQGANSLSNVFVGGTLTISTSTMNTTVNGFSFYANSVVINIGGGSFTSNSVFYPRSNFTLEGQTTVTQNTMPQFYVASKASFTFKMKDFTILPGCYFMQGDDKYLSLAGGAGSGGLAGATGIFVGDFADNFNDKSKNNVLSKDQLDKLLWDKDLIDFLTTEGASATATIEGNVSGKVGVPFKQPISIRVEIAGDTLNNTTLSEDEVMAMLWNIPDGLKVKYTKIIGNDSAFYLDISDTPLTPSNEPIVVIIPKELLGLNKDIAAKVDGKAASWDILRRENVINVATSSVFASFGTKGPTLHDITGE